MWKEMIHLRTAGPKQTEEALRQLRAAAKGPAVAAAGAPRLSLFASSPYDTDLCLILRWAEGNPGNSTLGNRLEDLLKTCGITLHTSWRPLPLTPPGTILPSPKE